MIREGQLQAWLSHPHVLHIHDVFEHQGAPVLVMGVVEGPSLREVLLRERLALHEADHLARGLLAGVAAAHADGLVHRDLKPGNVLLDLSMPTPRALVADFGLVKDLDDATGGTTRSGATMGTPAFMAPEQHRRARHVDARADVFSLGAILYELLTGHRMLDTDDPIAAYQLGWEGRWTLVQEHRPEVPEAVVEVVRRAVSAGGQDCDDSDPQVNPGVDETWYDGVDGDCDGWSDFDRDRDGFDALSQGGDDCDDRDDTVFPGAPDAWYDGVDADCAGDSDYDKDGDGYDAEVFGGGDCDDENERIHPGAQEIPLNGIDENCDESLLE